jgi:hypothetical protein
MPSRLTAAATGSRKSKEQGFAIRAGFLPSQHLESPFSYFLKTNFDSI